MTSPLGPTRSASLRRGQRDRRHSCDRPSEYIWREARRLTQNLFTVAKLGAMTALILFGLTMRPKILPVAGPYVPPIQHCPVTLLAALVVAQVGSFFSCDGWHYIGNVVQRSEIPRRTLPLSLLAGPAIVVGLYLLANLAYLRLLGPTGIATANEDRVGARPWARYSDQWALHSWPAPS